MTVTRMFKCLIIEKYIFLQLHNLALSKTKVNNFIYNNRGQDDIILSYDQQISYICAHVLLNILNCCKNVIKCWTEPCISSFFPQLIQ